ncbi:hypothetical protein B0H10DRAFT_4717 [Mycena sp. CBHHK59/15]|nr:hypothetical protein B0H10DRAFT_4717 [Mycena sp. CBHHK59/15]
MRLYLTTISRLPVPNRSYPSSQAVLRHPVVTPGKRLSRKIWPRVGPRLGKSAPHLQRRGCA